MESGGLFMVAVITTVCKAAILSMQSMVILGGSGGIPLAIF